MKSTLLLPENVSRPTLDESNVAWANVPYLPTINHRYYAGSIFRVRYETIFQTWSIYQTCFACPILINNIVY